MNKRDYLHENIEKLVGNTRRELTIPEHEKEQILNNLIEEANSLSSGVTIRRLKDRFRTSRIAALATAAGLIVAVFLGVVVLNELTAPAYAIEQTIKALQEISTVHVIGTNWDDVNDANTTIFDPNNVYMGRIDSTSYDPVLDYLTTYYWRVRGYRKCYCSLACPGRCLGYYYGTY